MLFYPLSELSIAKALLQVRAKWAFFLSASLLLAGIFFMAPPLHAAPVAAGTVISNTAAGSYIDSAGGRQVSVSSNTVSLTVAALEALTLTASQNIDVGAGSVFALSHTLTNTGNTAANFAISIQATAIGGNGLVPVNFQVVRDTNGNGIADAGETALTAGTLIFLNPGEKAILLLVGQIPGTAQTGQSSQLLITATSQGQGATASNTDVLTISPVAALAVTLSASSATAVQGGRLTFTATTFNAGSLEARAQPILVNGIATSLVVMRVPIPVNVVFDPSLSPVASLVSGAGGATGGIVQVLYHLEGTAANSYSTTMPAGAVVDAIAWGVASLPPDTRLQGQFSVTVNATATGSVTATAFTDWLQQGIAVTTRSNTVILPLAIPSATITFYSGTNYTTVANQSAAGAPLFVQAQALACNASRTEINTVPITLVSVLTGDTETLTGVETGPNTGIFRIVPSVPTFNVVGRVIFSGDGILEVLRNDTVTARITACGGVTAEASTTLLIDPSGVVYDSVSNQPVAGATVRLIDVSGSGNGGRPGAPAVVFKADGATRAPSEVVTLVDGFFEFPLVAPSTYRLQVTPPTGYAFASKAAPAALPAGRRTEAQGSYGASFQVSNAPVRFDVPVDPAATGVLLIEKTANKTVAEVGDFVDYRIRLNNTTAAALTSLRLDDALPAGFAFVPGSARLNNAVLANPMGSLGSSLQFALGSLPAATQVTLTYRLRVGAGSQSGDGVNTAQASSDTVVSNRATARVQVVGGVFSEQAYLIGRVTATACPSGDGPDGLGVPGVRIYLEDGTYAVTDGQGQYSFYNLTPRTHVAKVDKTTLPAGTALQIVGNRDALDAGSQFVDVTKGELRKANFVLGPCSASLQAQIIARRKALTNPSEILQAASTLLPSTLSSTVPVDGRTLPASGITGLPGTSRAATGLLAPGAVLNAVGAVGDLGGPVAPPALPTLPGGAAPAAPSAPVDEVDGELVYLEDANGMRPLSQAETAMLARDKQRQEAAKTAAASAPVSATAAMSTTAVDMDQPLEALLPGLTPELGFVGLLDGQVLPSDQTRIRVKGPINSSFALNVNGVLVPATQVGKRTSLEKTGTLAWEYIGVNLKPGRNTLRLDVLDGFGNVRSSAEIAVLAPGPLATIALDVPQQPVADAATPIVIGLRLLDANGLPVLSRTQITLNSTSLGQWQTLDLDIRQPGTQVFVEGGEAAFLMVPPAQPEKAQIFASSGLVKSDVAAVEFLPNLRPMIAAGLIEGTINLRNLNPLALQPVQSGDVFERQIRSASRSFGSGDKNEVAARAAVFLKGKVSGSTLLTLAYDSDKPADTALFRDIQPNQFYPVYGDSSARGFDAQSTGRLYVLVQNGTSYALLGDFSTQSDNRARQLTQSVRALNGAKARLEEGPLVAEAFVARTSATLVVQEFRANGTSGPFRLNSNGVVNSQQVSIVTRNRNQLSVIVKTTPLSALTDYEIEPFTGQLLLKDPVPSVDSDLNPVLIRVSYSVDLGGPKHTVAGAEARLDVLPGVVLGANAMRDADPLNKQSLVGLNLAAKIGEQTTFSGELARSQTDLQGKGNAQRGELRHEGADLKARVYGVHTEAGFYNPSSLQSAGQSEYGAKIGYQVDEKNRLVAEALKTGNSVTGAAQTGVELKLEHSLSGNMKLEAGVRFSRSNALSALSSGVPFPGETAVLPPLPADLDRLGGAAAAQEEIGYTSARVKLSTPVPGLPQAEVFGVVEAAIDGSGGKEVGVGGTYAINPGTKLYLRHNFINSLKGPYNLNSDISQYSTVAGINTELWENTQLFNEYRIGDSIDGRSSEAAIGIRQRWRLENGLGLTGSFQRIKPITGTVSNDSTAITLGADYIAAEDWKASGQAQWQSSTSSSSWLLSGALTNKINANWTLLNRALYTTQTSTAPGGGERRLVSAQTGVAWRPVDSDTWNGLARIQLKRDKDSTLGADLGRDETALILSTHLNFQLNPNWVMTARYAAKKAQDNANGLSWRSLTQLLGGRSTWDITERWDVGVQAYRLWGNGAAEAAYGLEVGYLAMKNLWLSVGYNARGFKAPDLASEAATQRGLYLRLRFKFDETSFGFDGASAAAASASAVPSASTRLPSGPP